MREKLVCDSGGGASFSSMVPQEQTAEEREHRVRSATKKCAVVLTMR